MQNTFLNLQKIDTARERMENPRLEPVLMEVWSDKLALFESCVFVDPLGIPDCRLEKVEQARWPLLCLC